MAKTVYYVSDGTGITAYGLGHSLITQFDKIPFQTFTLPYINTEEKALETLSQINESFSLNGERPIVFSTIVKPEIRNIIIKANALVIDFFQSFLGTLEEELQTKASKIVGLSHAVLDHEQYHSRIEAVNFTMRTDDGVHTESYNTADIVLVGVSRSGKTPTCLYLSLQHGIRAANYPLTPEDLKQPDLPQSLLPYQQKLFGLTISPIRLHQIRSVRRPNSQYCALSQCKEETQLTENLFKLKNIPYINSTDLSIEELSTQIMIKAMLKR